MVNAPGYRDGPRRSPNVTGPDKSPGGSADGADTDALTAGQSIRQEIEKGIASCRFGVVIISPSFFVRQSTQAELDALFGKRWSPGRAPSCRSGITSPKTRSSKHSPLLAGLLALNTAVSTVEEIADSLVEAVHAETSCVASQTARSSTPLQYLSKPVRAKAQAGMGARSPSWS